MSDYHDSYSPRQWIFGAIHHLDATKDDDGHPTMDAISLLVRALSTVEAEALHARLTRA